MSSGRSESTAGLEALALNQYPKIRPKFGQGADIGAGKKLLPYLLDIVQPLPSHFLVSGLLQQPLRSFYEVRKMATKIDIASIVANSVHGSESISQRPDISLIIWQVIEIGAGTRHFIGYDVDASEGRVSTGILRYDTRTRTGVTASGRVYALLGSPGHDKDAHYVWGIWKRVNSVKSARDVTAEYE